MAEGTRQITVELVGGPFCGSKAYVEPSVLRTRFFRVESWRYEMVTDELDSEHHAEFVGYDR